MPDRLLKSFYLFGLKIGADGAARVRVSEKRRAGHKPWGNRLGVLALLVVLLACAPKAAEAGTFDCLGDLDWGCRILSFLFDTANVQGGNAVTYVKDGRRMPPDQPGERSVQGALRAMMGFFSNAILIIASLKLLYEVLQMTAETAQSGRVGGRETNQLWAPIRLVVAIGLLVPLSSGLNSGQHILLQIAKWGSGMASQAWVVFAKYLAEDQNLAAPVPGRVYRLSVDVFKSLMCANFINHYAFYSGTHSFERVLMSFTNTIRNGNTPRIVFGNKIDNEVCGHVDLKVPLQASMRNPDSLIAYRLTQINNEEFGKALADIFALAGPLSLKFLPPNDTSALPSTDQVGQINDAIQRYQDNIKTVLGRLDVGTTAMQQITAVTAGVLVVSMVATLFLLAGVLLGFVVPLMPFVRFFFAILTWLGTLFEGMICLPFLALAHLTPKGEGFTGQNARAGYYLVFQIFLRPILTLFGLIAAMLLFYVAAKFLNAMFYEATSGIAFYDGGMRFMQKLVYSLIYVGLIYISANLSFKMIEHIPRHALKWMGQQVSEEPYDDHQNFLQVAAAIGGQQMLSNFSSLPKTAGEFVSAPLLGSAAAVSARRDVLLGRKNHMWSSGMKWDQSASGGKGAWMPNYQGTATQIADSQRDMNTAEQDVQREEATVQRETAVLQGMTAGGMSSTDPAWVSQEAKVGHHEGALLAARTAYRRHADDYTRFTQRKYDGK